MQSWEEFRHSLLSDVEWIHDWRSVWKAHEHGEAQRRLNKRKNCSSWFICIGLCQEASVSVDFSQNEPAMIYQISSLLQWCYSSGFSHRPSETSYAFVWQSESISDLLQYMLLVSRRFHFFQSRAECAFWYWHWRRQGIVFKTPIMHVCTNSSSHSTEIILKACTLHSNCSKLKNFIPYLNLVIKDCHYKHVQNTWKSVNV